MLAQLREMVTRGGPEPPEYGWLSAAFPRLRRAGVSPKQVAAVFGPTLTPECLHGHGYLKPRGYAGDFEIIDRIYTSWLSPDPRLARWDRYFHAQPAPRAVRNRKVFFKTLLAGQTGGPTRRPALVLNIGSGPARDVFEFLSERPNAPLCLHCVDLDPQAVAHGLSLCSAFADKAHFECRNALRLRPSCGYELIWSAGLFDYLPDRLFVALVRRFYPFVEPGGELVIGNFSPRNPSRAYMELLAEWYLEHRTPAQLRQLATAAGVPAAAICVDQEPEGVNLFLRLKAVDPIPVTQREKGITVPQRRRRSG
jgi:SAM-dependent methyltransferase